MDEEKNQMPENKAEETNIYAGLGTGITALIFSIISVVMLRFIIISVIFGILGIVFGYMSTRKGNGMGKAGLYISGISIFLTIFLFIVLNVLDIETLFMVPDWYK